MTSIWNSETSPFCRICGNARYLQSVQYILFCVYNGVQSLRHKAFGCIGFIKTLDSWLEILTLRVSFLAFLFALLDHISCLTFLLFFLGFDAQF